MMRTSLLLKAPQVALAKMTPQNTKSTSKDVETWTRYSWNYTREGWWGGGGGGMPCWRMVPTTRPLSSHHPELLVRLLAGACLDLVALVPRHAGLDSSLEGADVVDLKGAGGGPGVQLRAVVHGHHRRPVMLPTTIRKQVHLPLAQHLQPHAAVVRRISSRRTNETQETWVYSHDGPIQRRWDAGRWPC
eukprot:300846-Prorocentrum_minimum.AAC.2